jgi:NAD(P)-dependent dehydrogenase (short-subunit alcohol dehydrogenase family)
LTLKRGIVVLEEWDWSSEKSLRRVMEVNFFGHVAVTKAFLRMILITYNTTNKEKGGRGGGMNK